MPDKTNGRFLKGERVSPKTEFKPGQHWRNPRPHWSREWLITEYVEKKRSTGDIAKEAQCTDANILFWLRKHGIPRRTVSEAREIKHWGAKGEANPMYGRVGAKNPHWKGGLTPLRQSFYANEAWKKAARRVRRRDKACRLCQSSGPFDIHHIIPFRVAPLLACEDGNLILLCRECHKNVERKGWKRWQTKLFSLIERKEA